VQPDRESGAPEFGPVDVPTDPFSVRIQDAAYEEFLSFGIRRATLDSIARRAQVGRMTLHRRFANKQQLFAAVLLRENARVVGELDRVAAEQSTLVDALVESLAHGIEAIRVHPLFSRLLQTDRDALAPFLTYETAPLMADAIRFITDQLEKRGGSSEVDPQAVEAIFRVCHSIRMAPDALQDLRDPPTLRDFLRRVIRAFLDVD